MELHSSNNLMNPIPLNLYMGKVKQIEIKNGTYYFYNDTINIEEFNSNVLKIDKKSFRDIDIYYIGSVSISKIGLCRNIYSLYPLYLIIVKVDGHIKENNRNKYLVFDSTDENKKYLKSTENFGMGLKMKLQQ